MDRQEKMKMYDRIYPGKKWLDTEGKPIQAHGFSVFWNEEAGLWYWYGENKEKTVGGRKNSIWHWGVRLYTSSDLYNWEDRGLIIEPRPEDQFIACADRWMPQWYVRPIAKMIQSGMKRHFADYTPDTSPQEAKPLEGKVLQHTENTSISRYVWLPIRWNGEKPVIRWRKEWSLG